MYIHRIIMKDVPGSPDRDITLWNDWKEEPLKSVLFTGMNGTGKTTTLRLIAAIWAGFADALLPQSSILQEYPVLERQLQKKRCIAALEIHGLIDKPICLWMGHAIVDSERFIEERISKDVLCIRVQPNPTPSRKPTLAPVNLPLDELIRQVEKLQLGISNISYLPNMVFIDSEIRQVSEIKEKIDRYRTPFPEPLYSWFASYNPEILNGNGFNASLEQMLRNLKIRDPEWFSQTLQDINTFFIGKKITDFDSSLNLMVELESGKQHDFYDLSSGERQCLLLMFMVSRWMMPGGVVLIDEPDLHLHMSLQRQFIRALERLVLKKEGQLIITSHSPTVWEEYSRRQHITFSFEEQHG